MVAPIAERERTEAAKVIRLRRPNVEADLSCLMCGRSVGQIIGGKVYHHADCSSRLRVEGRMLRCCQCGGTIYREPVSPLLGQ
ncbi:MAG: hypothetical protein IT305_32135 [Chloroflexi bacterium]|nr:hypothetical protein [Chloroflexota bacterium]